MGPRVLSSVCRQIGVLRKAPRGDRFRERNRLHAMRGARRARRRLSVPGGKLVSGPPRGVGKRKLVITLAVALVVLASGTLLSQRIPDAVSAPLFLLAVILEVVVAPIPGGAIGYLGAARFGFWEAWPLLYLGNVIGTTLVFLLARRYGAPLFEAFVSPRTRERYDQQLQERPFLLWLVYAVPLIPVDVLSILAGLSSIPASRFFLTSFTGYVFYTAIVAYVGDSLSQFIGVTNAISVLGGIFFLGLILWVWNGSRKAARERRSAPRS